MGEDGVCVHNANCGFQKFVDDPKSLWGKSADEVGEALGEGWTLKPYGKSGTGWHYINNAHPDMKVVYHAADGIHKSQYYMLTSGSIRRIKLVDVGYVARGIERATIIHIGG